MTNNKAIYIHIQEIGFQASEEFPSLRLTISQATDTHVHTGTDPPKNTVHHSNSPLTQQSTVSNVRHANQRKTKASQLNNSQRTRTQDTATCIAINNNNKHADAQNGASVYPTCVLVSLARAQRLSSSRVCPPQHKIINNHHGEIVPKDILIPKHYRQ